MRRDEILVVARDEDRAAKPEDLVREFRKRADFDEAQPGVSIRGNVRHPGTFPFEAGMELSDMLRAAGDLGEETDTRYALLARESQPDGKLTVSSDPA